jgi:hypothetical protein
MIHVFPEVPNIGSRISISTDNKPKKLLEKNLDKHLRQIEIYKKLIQKMQNIYYLLDLNNGFRDKSTYIFSHVRQIMAHSINSCRIILRDEIRFRFSVSNNAHEKMYENYKKFDDLLNELKYWMAGYVNNY